MKKNHIVLALFAVSSLCIYPDVLVAQAKEGKIEQAIARAKKEYNEFKSAFSCLRKSGFKTCSSAEKKRIVATGAAVIAVLTLLVFRTRRIQEARMAEEVRVVRGGAGVAGIPSYDPPLHQAIMAKDLASVQRFIGEGADVNAPGFARWTSLHVVLQSTYWDRDIFNTLLQASGISLDVQDNLGRTPLNYSVGEGNVHAVAMLLDRIANPQDLRRIITIAEGELREWKRHDNLNKVRAYETILENLRKKEKPRLFPTD